MVSSRIASTSWSFAEAAPRFRSASVSSHTLSRDVDRERLRQQVPVTETTLDGSENIERPQVSHEKLMPFAEKGIPCGTKDLTLGPTPVTSVDGVEEGEQPIHVARLATVDHFHVHRRERRPLGHGRKAAHEKEVSAARRQACQERREAWRRRSHGGVLRSSAASCRSGADAPRAKARAGCRRASRRRTPWMTSFGPLSVTAIPTSRSMSSRRTRHGGASASLSGSPAAPIPRCARVRLSISRVTEEDGRGRPTPRPRAPPRRCRGSRPRGPCRSGRARIRAARRRSHSSPGVAPRAARR